YFGAGIGIPEKLQGKRVLDIGCGSGSFVFMLSKLVGPDGYVVGVDYSDGLKWGYSKANFEFHVGDAEKLDVFNWGAESFDLIVHAFNLLKTGGQFYLTDVYVERDMPAEYKENEHLWCGGAGAMRWDTLAPTVVKAGFTVPYLTQAYPVSIVHEEFKVMTEVSRLLCAGWRLFKLPDGAKRGASRTGEGVDVDSELATILAFSYLSDNFDFADTTGNPTTNRNQNPFALLEKLEAEGRKPDPMYTVE
ncbi:hypothetical protein BaRGS_00008187, partial [Batillaria attramentaria]